MMKYRLILWAGLILYLTMVPVGQAQQLYLMTVGDVEDKRIGECVQAGMDCFVSIFSENLPGNRLVIYNAPQGKAQTWKGPDLNQSKDILKDFRKAINACPAGPEDTLLVFWYSYGGLERKEIRLWRSSDSEENKIVRSDLTHLIQTKNTRLAGLITESGKMFIRKESRTDIPGVQNRDHVTPIMDSLLFQSHGFIDFNSSQGRQNPIMTPKWGSALIAALCEVVEHGDFKSLTWPDLVAQCNDQMKTLFNGTRQNIEVYSLPGDTVANNSDRQETQATTTIRSDTPNSRTTTRTAARSTKTGRVKWNWDQYAADYQSQKSQREAEPYPEDFRQQGNSIGLSTVSRRGGDYDAAVAFSGRFGQGYWSAPVYHPEAGDLLLAINGIRINNYNGFLSLIQSSPAVIYLTVADHWRGEIYEMRTWLPPASGQKMRLGLFVVNNPFGGVRITGIAAGSPATRCQYRLRWGQYYYDFPAPLPYPVPNPNPIDPIDPVPNPNPIDPIDPVPNPNPVDPIDPIMKDPPENLAVPNVPVDSTSL